MANNYSIFQNAAIAYASYAFACIRDKSLMLWVVLFTESLRFRQHLVAPHWAKSYYALRVYETVCLHAIRSEHTKRIVCMHFTGPARTVSNCPKKKPS